LVLRSIAAPREQHAARENGERGRNDDGAGDATHAAAPLERHGPQKARHEAATMGITCSSATASWTDGPHRSPHCVFCRLASGWGACASEGRGGTIALPNRIADAAGAARDEANSSPRRIPVKFELPPLPY